jgi:hypothetical protein
MLFLLAVLWYLLTPWSRILLEKLTGFQLVKKFPAFYATWRFIIAVTSVLLLFRNMIRLYGEEFQHLAQPPSWRTTPCRLSTTVYSIYSQLNPILEAVHPSATWGPAILWWQGPTYHGFCDTLLPTSNLNFMFYFPVGISSVYKIWMNCG